MMRTTVKNRIEGMRIRIAVATAVVLALLSAALMISLPSYGTAQAETGCTVTIHVYDPAKEYNKLVGWIWIMGSSSDGGGRGEFSTSAAADEPFYKGDNRAYTIDISFNDASAARLKNGTPLGFLICLKKGASGSWNDMYDKEGLPDVYVNLSGAFDESNHADVYFVRKDTEAFTDVEVAKMALEKITSAKFTSKTAMSFETSSAVKSGAKVSLIVDGNTVASATPTLNSNGLSGTVNFTGFTLDLTKDYKVSIDGFPKTAGVSKSLLVDDIEFIRTFETADVQNMEFGANCTSEKTTFRLWAPLAANVTLNLYSAGVGGEPNRTAALKKHTSSAGKWTGAWELELDGDFHGTYYTYSIDNTGAATETIDPYAKACGANGDRGMVIDFKRANPTGWDSDSYLCDTNAVNADTPIVWEIHVKDFSVSPDSGMKYKGKYLAFTEQNTHVPGNTSLKTGISYLKDLGITYVHLNPVYDFATIDESDLSTADRTKDSFNWGYDPMNYNIPEGSYSTDPSKGEVRVKEFKQMVMALHKAGIGVVMDVVYNHTYSVTGQSLNDTVPGYYHRTNDDGSLSNGSGCGNETASERTMMRKYIVDSIVYWATEYHIDGFRFDLMGIHDVDTIKAVREGLDKVKNKNGITVGQKLLIYGEPWSADGEYVPQSYKNRIAVTNAGVVGVTGYAVNSASNTLLKVKFAAYDYQRDMTVLPDRVAVFNDTGRDGLHGGWWDAVPYPDRGWACGGEDIARREQVIRMMAGGCADGQGMNTKNGAGNVAYSSAHDNFTLWDQLEGKRSSTQTPLAYDYADTNRISKCKLISSAYLLSTGIVFILAGDEMGRTKYGNDNSYASPHKLNMIKWSRYGQAGFSSLYQHYKKMISLRKKYSSQLFSYSKSVDATFCKGDFSNTTTDSIKYTRTKNGTTLTCSLNRSKWDACSGSIQIGSDRYNF